MVNAKDVFIPEGTSDPTAVKAFSTITPVPGELWTDNTGKNRLIIKAFEGHCVVLLLMDAPLRDTTEITADGKIYYINTKMPTVTLRKAYGEKIGTLDDEAFEEVLRKYADDQDIQLTITAGEVKADTAKDDFIKQLKYELEVAMNERNLEKEKNKELSLSVQILNEKLGLAEHNRFYKTMYNDLIDRILYRAGE